MFDLDIELSTYRQYPEFNWIVSSVSPSTTASSAGEVHTQQTHTPLVRIHFSSESDSQNGVIANSLCLKFLESFSLFAWVAHDDYWGKDKQSILMFFDNLQVDISVF